MSKTRTAPRRPRAAQVGAVDPPADQTAHIIEPLRPFAIPMGSLRLDERNPQLHDEASITAIARSMRTFGQDQPVIYRQSDGMIIKGNGRYQAAQKLNWSWIAAIPVDDPLVRAAARGVADNQASRLAGSDRTLMALVVQAIRAEDEALVGALGFTEKQIDAFLAATGGGGQRPGEDDLPPATKGKPRVKPGDLWLMERHRLVCGDATVAEHVERLMAGHKADLVWTDPPYGVDWRGWSHRLEPREALRGDNLDDAGFIDTLLRPAFQHLSRHTKPKAAIYIWHSTSRRRQFEAAMDAAGLVEQTTLIWAKPYSGAHGNYRFAHEPCFYCSHAGEMPNWYGDGGQSTVWRVGLAAGQHRTAMVGTGVLLLDERGGGRLFVTGREPKGRKSPRFALEDTPIYLHHDGATNTLWEITRDPSDEHPTQKPVETARRAMINSSRPADICLDLFLGSGTALIAAEMTNRVGYGLEIDPGYCDLAIRRWEAMTGRKATKE